MSHFHNEKENKILLKKRGSGTSLALQWLGTSTPNAGGTVSIPGRGTKIPHAARCSQRKKRVGRGWVRILVNPHMLVLPYISTLCDQSVRGQPAMACE